MKWAMVSVIAALALLVAAPSALANTFTVDSTGDQVDASPGTGGCATAVATCTLRAAIQEANHANNPGADIINFGAPFTGSAATSTITVGSALPTISGSLTIQGGDCDPTAEAKPCVGINGGAGISPLATSAGATSISGVAFSGVNFAISINGGTGSTVRGNWFGMGLDQSSSPIGRGVFISSTGATSVTVGGSTALQRNVFTYATLGVDIFDADSNTITGNYFGALPNGSLPASPVFGTAVRIQGNTGTLATDNRVGGPDTGTPTVCDGECNLVIDGSGQAVKVGASGVGTFADNTSVVGNFLGLSRDGTTGMAIDNGVIDVQNATDTTIGGTASAARNYIAASAAPAIPAVALDEGSTGALVRSNFFGVDATGTQTIDNNDESLRVSAPGTQVRDNTFASSGDPGADGELHVRDAADSSTIRGNSFGVGVGGVDIVSQTGGANAPLVGIKSDNNQIGGTAAGDGNVFGFANADALFIGPGSDPSSGNTIQGNRIGTDQSETAVYPVNGHGIVVAGLSNDNTIGGTTAAGENVISNVAQANANDDAIAIFGATNLHDSVLRNRGTTNGSLFLDFAPDPGPNGGIVPPVAGAPTTTTIAGGAGSAVVGATVRAYRTQGTGGDIQEFIGSATVNGSGGWSVTFSPVQANGSCIIVNQTDATGNSSKFTAPQPIGGGSCDASAPNTQFNPVGQPTLVEDATPTFTFGTNPLEFPVTFACALNPPGGPPVITPDCPDGAGNGTYTPVTPLADGTYTLKVAARDSVGNQDLTPVSHTFTVDTTAPTVTIDSGPAAGSETADATPTFGFTATDATALTVQCRYDGAAFAACSGAGTHTPGTDLGEGQHTFEVRGTDALNHTTTKSRQFTVDTEPPVVTIDSGPADGSTTSDATPTIAFSATDTTAVGFECRYDGGAFAACSGAGTHQPGTDLGEGLHTFEVRATDAVVHSSSASRTFTVDAISDQPPADGTDKDPPETTIVKQPKRKTTKRKAKFAFESDEAGSTFECSLDGKPFKACAASLKLKVKARKHALRVRAIDLAGNVDPTPAQARWKVKRRRR